MKSRFLLPFAVFFALSPLARAQETMKIGAPVPELKAVTWLKSGPPFIGTLNSLKGKVVVLEFWATWCTPCVAAIPHLNELSASYRKRGVEFLALTDDSVDRLQGFLKEKPISAIVGTDPSRANWAPFGVPSIPYTVIVGKDGKLLATTRPDQVTHEVLDKALAGQALNLAPLEGAKSDLDWDRLIEWQDGVAPSAYVIIKPIKTFTSGTASNPDHVVSDGVTLNNLVQIAFQTDYFHLDWRLPESFDKGTYRFAARVPKDEPEKLHPLLRNSVTAYFGIKAVWEVQNRDVFVLKRMPGAAEPTRSTSATPVWQMMRGKITLKKQPIGSLLSLLTNLMGKPVIDETGLAGEYDLDLAYQHDNPKLLEDDLHKAGLELVPAKKDVKMLVVSKGFE